MISEHAASHIVFKEPMYLLLSNLPKVNSPLTSPLDVAGAKEMPTILELINPSRYAVSVTVRTVFPPFVSPGPTTVSSEQEV